jgi:DNA-binding CsgD family transcriptional regulator
MPKVSVSDYERVLKFSFFINKGYENFIDSVQFALSEYFNFTLSVYTTFNKDHNDRTFVESIKSTTAQPEDLLKYRDSYYRSDLFVKRIPYLVHENARKNTFTITDVASYEEFYSTEYGKHLMNVNNPYQAVVCATSAIHLPSHAINIFKTKEQGEFTEYELELLSLIGSVYNETLPLYKQYHANKKYISFLDVETKERGLGLAVLDERGSIVYCNHLFICCSSEIFDTESTVALVSAVNTAFYEQTGSAANKITSPAAIKIGKYDFQFNVYRITGIEGNMRFLFITVNGKNPAPKPDQKLRFVDEYNMTMQETEVATLMLQGLDNAKIAENLCINVTTVKFHMKNIFKKLGVNNRSAVISKLIK